jgi:hypothetical protein
MILDGYAHDLDRHLREQDRPLTDEEHEQEALEAATLAKCEAAHKAGMEAFAAGLMNRPPIGLSDDEREWFECGWEDGEEAVSRKFLTAC